MKKLFLLSIILSAQSALATIETISFSGVVTTKILWGDYVNIPGIAAADIGSPVTGFVSFNRNFPGYLQVEDAVLSFPGGVIAASQEQGNGGSLVHIPGGYLYANDSVGASLLGFDNNFSMTMLFNGAGTFFGDASFFEDVSNPDPTTDFDQYYAGSLFAVSTTPDTGTSIGLLAFALLVIVSTRKFAHVTR